MSALWSRFTSKLKDSGYTLNDLVYCNEDLFLTIAEDMTEFTPLQIASLAKEWQRWMQSTSPAQQQNSTLSTSLPPAVSRNRAAGDTATSRLPSRGSPPRDEASSASASRLSPSKSSLSAALRENAFSPPHRSPTKIKGEVDYLLTKLAAQTGEEYQVSPTEGLVAVEASPEAWSPFMDRLARMHPTRPPVNAGGQQESATQELQLLWKLCSPATLSKMEKACVSGAPFGLSNHDDTDGLCSSAVVFYHREATRLSASAHELGDLFRAGWALVAFDVAVGKARTVTKDEAQDLNANLYRFSMEQCLEMLEDAGFDSFHIPSRNAVAVCHMHQAMPRFVVYVTPIEPVVVSRRLGDKTADANGAKGGGAASVSPAAVPTRAPPVPAAAAPDPSAGGAPPATSLVRRVGEDLHCTVHPTKTVEFWSFTEKRLLCSHCLYYDGYSQENCIPIEQAAREEVPRLERWVQNATTFTQEMKGVFDLLEAAQTDVSQSQERVRSDIAQSFTRLRSRLDALETNLQQQGQQRAQQSHATLQDTLSRITALLQFVQDVVREADYPIAAYHSGSVDVTTCISVLRGTQRAFGAWEAVLIPSYENVSVVDGGAVLQPVEEALKAVQAVMTEPGKIQLPEAIDVNYLKVDCDV
ncbi:hypothetical protein ABB37_02931 [Leptomonas pyrrhocoris]|uniref:Uncharacterized protein n=1 Tax=Leptomonas pyrrhocoris TaxID=157538 RepID=A0A0N0DXR2_LEPPY|nr:hypothetical protein ABB37_02931 [Leptomonas pyrrhocoris]KPA83252.1 hypothetical protein ABB37_02931 [Leptomonas pyrrhocoris]|eukprot:XP_015661691.1 hypothetical protein ABB37_02931 [Leptomonas pyrrhocoris]